MGTTVQIFRNPLRRMTLLTESRLYSPQVAKTRTERKGGRELWDGQRIREIREFRRLSQQALADAAGTSKGDVSRHERNDPTSNPSVDVLARIADALSVPVFTLLEAVGSPIPEKATATRDERQHGAGGGVPALERIILGDLDRDAPAEDSTRGDILRAQHALASATAALNRALRRADEKSGAA